MTRHERALAEIARLRQVAQELTPEEYERNAYTRYAATFGPSLVLPWLDAAETVLRLHEPSTTFTTTYCDGCSGAPDYPCLTARPFLTLLAPSTEETK